MLIELRIQNHRSIRDEQVLTMEVGRVGDEADPRPRRVKGHRIPLLPAAALYGANASGKSNVLSALAFVKHAVARSHRSWSPDGGVPREPFAWGAAASEPSLFEVTVLLEGVRYRYGFVADEERFLEEWLYAWPRGRKQSWFERDGDSFKFGENLQGENRLVEEVTRPNALFLSAAVQHRHQQLEPLYRWLSGIQTIRVRRFETDRYPMDDELENDVWLGKVFLQGSTSDQKSRRAAFLELLHAADVGIVDVRVEDRRSEWEGPYLTVLVRHQSKERNAWLPLSEESAGTLALFYRGPLLLESLAAGGLLVVDELEASLHPLLALQILRLFTDPATNPNNAQLLFTTHDTNLLGTMTGEPALRRDQIWLTEKNDEGATTLYPLTDYKPRKGENLERGYLQGRYGAIPFLGELARILE